MTSIKRLASASLTVVLFSAALSSALPGEARCPGNADSIRLRFIGRSLIAVPIMLDNTGPYDFVVDTGAQITTIDRQLASELHPKPLGETYVTGVGTYSHAAYAQLGSLQAGTHGFKDPLILVQDLTQIQHTDPHVRGILGLNFLEHFDLLIDYHHRIFCLDQTRRMQQKLTGKHIGLTPPPHPDPYVPYTLPMIVSTRVSGISKRPLLLQLDSGIDVPLLFEYGKQLPRVQTMATSRHRRDADEVSLAFAVLMPQDIQVAAHSFRQISFVTPLDPGKDILMKPDVDGLLPTSLFRSVFISYTDRFAILER